MKFGGSIAKTLLNIKKFAIRNAKYAVSTEKGERPLGAALVDKAIKIASKERGASELLAKFERYLTLDGYALSYLEVQGPFGSKRELVDRI